MNKFKDEAMKTLGEKHDVHVPKVRGQRMQISDIAERLSDERLVECVSAQNDFNDDGSVRFWR